MYGGEERYPAKGGIEAIGLRELAEELAGLGSSASRLQP